MPDDQALNNAIEYLYVTQGHKLTQVELDKKIEELKKSFNANIQAPVAQKSVFVTPVVQPNILITLFKPDKTARDREIELIYGQVGKLSPQLLKSQADYVQSVYDNNDHWITQQLRGIGIVR